MANRASKRTKRKSDSIQEIVQTKHKKSHKPTTVITSGNLQFNVEVIQMASWRAFYLKLPEECFIFYEFCKSLNELTPLDAFVNSLGLKLVGPFELFARDGILPDELVDSPLYYRYFHDPPELVTIMTGSDGWHLGYFRDRPNDVPSLIVESEPEKCGTLKILGTSLFTVIKSLLNKRDSFKHVTSLIDEFTKKKDYALSDANEIIKQRKKRCVCSTLNEIGLVVPLNGDIGYRPLEMTYAKLLATLQSAVSASNEDDRLSRLEPIDELITFSQFACDEGDFGQAIELGLSLLAFHPKNLPLDRANILNSRIKHLLSVGYELAGCPEFVNVAVAHMQNRPIQPPTSMFINS
ncbi:hypothetical protein FBUS_06243 [Fasciolopsis buskii]|uniref:Uncharacterized protein n=1 Tax=Fasciolopsis buskii TaxID=27845 RepID=A0A8E0RRK8_9TREM|nr:hypothetical protein FBUS_06243 [Fasciolopsis buski]